MYIHTVNHYYNVLSSILGMRYSKVFINKPKIQNSYIFLLFLQIKFKFNICFMYEVRGDDPRFGDFQSDWVPILSLNTIRLTPSICRKKSVCLYHIEFQRY